MRIDAHQHFWLYDPVEYGWIDDHMAVLQRNYLPEDLLPELTAAGFTGTVAVQARQTPRETRWLLKLAEQNGFIKGIVGWTDLCRKEALLPQLDEFCRNPKFRGVRHVVQDEQDDRFMLRDDFLQGIAVLKDYGLTYDLLLFPKHLPVAEKVVSCFPDQPFVLDHIAKPLIRERISDPWKEELFRLAAHDNVFCKLSGMVTEADWKNRKQEDFVPYLDIVFEAFGPGRLMIGSDWPVCLLSGDYSHVTGIVEKYIAGMSPEIRQKILGENCSSFYGLTIPQGHLR